MKIRLTALCFFLLFFLFHIQNADARPARVNQIPKQSVKEGEALIFTVRATDEDNDTVTFTAANLPEGATFSGNTFTWAT